MISRLLGACVRVVLVVLLVSLPGLLIPGVSSESTQFAAFVAMFVGLLVFVEYSSPTPIMVEFRDAKPFNRFRFGALFLIVFLLTALMRGAIIPTPLGGFVSSVGAWIGQALDFAYSPIRLAVLMVPSGADAYTVQSIRAAAGIGCAISLASVIGFVCVMYSVGWPGRGKSFNLLTNLPMFDPTSGGDVIQRLSRGARLNVFVGVLLPFVIPVLVKGAGPFIDPLRFENPQAMVWLMALWAFLPASLCMRGIAMARLVTLISATRRKRYAEALASGEAVV